VRIDWMCNVLLESSNEIFNLLVLFWEVLDCGLWIWLLEKRNLYTREAKRLVPWYTGGTRRTRFKLNTISSDSPSPESEQEINRKQYLRI
jgi:hypothetical protein